MIPLLLLFFAQKLCPDLLANPAAGIPSQLRFGDGDDSHDVALRAPTNIPSHLVWALPSAEGGNGQVLATNGSVTSVDLTAPAAGITVSGCPITGAGSMTLALGDDLA